ncbi:MAG: nitrate ABC transporter substrate-binding protein [Methylobacteriaceae bacterium]|nr:nitrate ABC transporter substrate-binding protein [Methylobacteriaceae bacterium]
MSERVRFAVRDWDYITPLLLKDVTDPAIEPEIVRVPTLPDDFIAEGFDASEVSFSRYAQARTRGETEQFGVPFFLMRGFRHRCVIVMKDSPFTEFKHLKGRRIGVTGWQDSGNIWTREAIADGGPGIEEATWYAGRLTEKHAIEDRLGKFARPGRIMAVPDEKPMMAALEDGELDAVCTPFMPVGFFAADSKFRHLITDLRGAELAYYRRTGYVPGIHVLAFSEAYVAAHPGVPGKLQALIAAAQAMWLEKRRKYADTTPWIIDDLGVSGRELAPAWDAYGLEPNRVMITDFLNQMYTQQIIGRPATPEDVFPQLTG